MDECGGFCCARPACIIIIIVQEGLLCASGNEMTSRGEGARRKI